jgi:hypothetical protein
MSYLSCPSCKLTLFERNPLTSPRHCPRCARRGSLVELEPGARSAPSFSSGILGAEREQREGDAEDVAAG